MRTIPNRKLTDNFWLYEIIEAQLPKEAVELNWKHIDEFDEANAKKIAEFIQSIRDLINIKFWNRQDGIGLRITSGFRCKEWEQIRGRSGNSRHTKSDAVDVQPICPPELAVEIIQYLYEIFSPRKTGHRGGFAIKKPTYQDGKIIAVGFAHFDLRPTVARWEY